MRARVLSPWMEPSQRHNAIHLKVDEYTRDWGCIKDQDSIKLLNAPRLGVAIVEDTKAVIDQIDADPECIVLSRSDQADRKPSQARLDKIRARLRRLVKGERITVEAANRIMGSDLTKVQIARRIAEQIKAL